MMIEIIVSATGKSGCFQSVKDIRAYILNYGLCIVTVFFATASGKRIKLCGNISRIRQILKAFSHPLKVRRILSVQKIHHLHRPLNL